MDIPFAKPADAGHAYHVRPDEVDELVSALKARGIPGLRIDEFPQFAGRRVHALTVTGEHGDVRNRQRLFISRPHAHEPAGTAAGTELVKALTGYGDDAGRYAEWRRWVLDHFVITVVSDANPGGSQRAPVKFWDGTIPNERFFLWMFGESGGRPGERFPRVSAWDIREVTPPALTGIAYEQTDEHTYVEPNRDYRSTFFRAFFDLDRRYHYHVWLDLHQTEYLNSDRNAHVCLPTCYDDLPEGRRAQLLSLGEAIHARWRREGGMPFDAPVAPYRNNDAQRNFLSRVWRPLAERMITVMTEVQNNNPRTPVPMQVHLQLAAILETMDWMLANAPS